MRTLLSALLVAGLVASPAFGAPLGTAFTYQGELTDVGAPVSGSGDFQFTLYDDESAGIVIGAPLQLDDVALAAGRFTVQLDFGEVFGGAALWLEIRVRTPHDPSDTAPFTILNPRQAITAAPFAHHALGELWKVSGGAITNVPGFVGINRDFPTGLEYFGVHAPITNGYGGMYVTTEGANGLPFYGYRTFGGHSAWTYLDGPTGDWRLNVDGDRVTVTDAPGLMGVGTTNPTEKLEVAGTIYSSTGGFKFPDGTTQTTAATSAGGNTLDQAYDEGGAGNGRTIVADAGAVAIQGAGLNISANTLSGVAGLTIDQTGNGYVATYRVAGTTVGGIDHVGRVGIGVTPIYRLDVREASGSANVMHLERTTGGAASADLFELEIPETSSVDTQFIEAQFSNNDVKFRVWGDGDVSADGVYSAGGADFAEVVRVSRGAHSVEAGDVIVIDPNAERGFAQSSAARSSLVAGVYSTRPGVIASEHDWDRLAEDVGLARLSPDGEVQAVKPLEVAKRVDEVPLAVVGIVPCKVSAENGPIRAGDLLVTSATPGHAMRDDEPRAGTIVGKALGELSSGTGVITILVTLQ